MDLYFYIKAISNLNVTVNIISTVIYKNESEKLCNLFINNELIYNCSCMVYVIISQIWPWDMKWNMEWIWNEAGQRLIEFCQENTLVIANTVFQQHKKRLYTWKSSDSQLEIRLIIFFAAKDGEALYSQQKQERELTVTQTMNSLLSNSDLSWRK